MKKVISIIIAVIILSGFTVFAEESPDEYKNNYDSFVGSDIEELLDGDTLNKLQENNINPENSDWVNNITVNGVFSFILNLIKGDIKKPFTAFLTIVFTVMVLSAFSSFGEEKSVANASIAATAVIAFVLITDMFSLVCAAESGIKTSSGFMIGFIPVFATIVAASGRAITAVSSSTVLMLAANAVSFFAAFGVLPIMGGYLSISLTSGLSPVVSRLNIANTVKKVTLWVLSLVSTVFLGVLSVQTAVNSAADGVSVKAAKFILGTSVPVAGTVLSESISTVFSSLSLLKGSVGIYAVTVIIVIMFPIVLDILLWRACFFISSEISSFFGEEKMSVLLHSVDSVLACLLGIVLLVMALFIISLTVLISAGKGI